MCHVGNLSVVNRERLRAMPAEYRKALERRLEYGEYVPSTRQHVTPIFEAIYAQWQEREAARIAARSVGNDLSMKALDAILAEANR